MADLNQGCVYRSTLPPSADGRLLLEYLTERYPHSTEESWRTRIEAGRIELDDRRASPGSRLRRGQRLVWRRPPWREPPVPCSELDVLYDDGDLLAVAKPAGLPTLPGAGYLEHTVLGRVRRFAPDAAPVHRLGRWTSGVLLMARRPRTRADLGRRWDAVEKRYRALASGRAEEAAFELCAPIGKRPHGRLGWIHATADDGRAARTSVRLLEQRRDAFLCDVRISTGRPHQIRIHLAVAGHPLVGDPLYRSGGDVCDDAVPGDPGYLLHAASLDLRHPARGCWLSLRAAIPGPLRPEGRRQGASIDE